MVGILTIHLHIPGCTLLKEKRLWLKLLIARLHREFNISMAEMYLQDRWQEVIIAWALVNNGRAQIWRSLQPVSKWVVAYCPDGMVVEEKLEMI